jgi:hypothetical protein
VGLFIGSLCIVVTRDGAIIIEPDSLRLLVESIADWDVEVGDFAIVEHVTGGRLVESVLVVEDVLLEVTDSILVALCRNGGGGLSIGNGL